MGKRCFHSVCFYMISSNSTFSLAWKQESIFFLYFFFFFFWVMLWFSQRSALSLTLHTGDPNCCSQRFQNEQEISQRVSHSAPPPVSPTHWRMATETVRVTSAYHRPRLLWWLKMKDDITRSVVIRCHRLYWFSDRLAPGGGAGGATADSVCCLFLLPAFLAWCNWHRVYWLGNYCNTWDS